MAEQLFHVGIKALIKNQSNQILVLQADTSHHKSSMKPYWDIPGGRIQDEEDALSTLIREVAEETGVTDFESVPLFLTAVISKHRIPVSDELTVGLVLLIYTVTIARTASIILSPEHTKYEWVDIETAGARLADKYPPEFIAKL